LAKVGKIINIIPFHFLTSGLDANCRVIFWVFNQRSGKASDSGRFRVICAIVLFLHQIDAFMNIYLVGYMGSGKSTIGRQLSRKLNYIHLDLDDFFEENYRISIMDFFEKYDEATFRKIETILLKKTLDFQDHVISTGGGTPCFNDNMNLINQNGISVYIRMNPVSLFNRLKNAKRPRPRTAFLDDEALITRIEEDLNVRREFYEQARLTIKGESIDIDALVSLLSGYLRIS
jgi:shikimate kinase